MFQLSTFYRSKAWQNLLRKIKSERLNQDGNIICEYCGKPIVKKFDCIGHHKIALTPQNVNDVNVSLNSENVALVHHSCHNTIHRNKFFNYHDRKVYIVYGPPLAGKTSYVSSVANAGDLILDIDNIWQALSGLSRYKKPATLNVNVFAVRDLLLDQIKTRRGKWHNAYIIGGYPYDAERKRLSDELNAEEILIDTSKQECLDRLTNCDDGRDRQEWLQYINKWFAIQRMTTPPTSHENDLQED